MKTIKQLFTLTNRIVRQNLTSVDTIITSIVMPIFILLFFVYVIGGNILVGAQQESLQTILATLCQDFC